MLPNYSELLQTSLIVAVLAAAVMSRIEEIAKKLNSVGLGITDDLRDAMMDYFGEDDDEDNNDDTDNDDTTGEVNAIPVPLSSTVIPQIDIDLTRQVFWYDACSDDTGTSDTLDYAGGVFKKTFWRTPCSTPTADVAGSAKKSSILHPVITESIDGKQQYDWQSKFTKFCSIPEMKKYHVLQFCM